MLTSEQMATIKADIEADPAFSSLPHTSDGAWVIAGAYSEMPATPFIVWRTDVSAYKIREVLVWAEYDSLSVSKQNAFSFLCSNGSINAALANVREGIASIFAGPGQALTRAALIAIAKRPANRIEKLLATGTGSDASPATMVHEGSIPYQYIMQIMGW